MINYTNLDDTKSYKELKKLGSYDVAVLDRKRIENCVIKEAGDLKYSYAAMPVDDEIVNALGKLAQEQQLVEKYRELLVGSIANPGEKRMVLHHLTRGRVLSDCKVMADGVEKGDFYAGELKKIEKFSNAVRSGKITGSTGKKFEHVVQIGIGGSDLGPRALCLALNLVIPSDGFGKLDARFISNVDPDDACAVLEGLDLEKTLFILVSKSGTTLETLTNRDLVFKVMRDRGIAKPENHMVAVTSNTSPLAKTPGILEVFFMDDFIGGRYSSTSAVGGVILSLTYGYDVFAQVLEGAHDEDVAALETDIRKNGPLMDAMIGVYLRNVLNYPYTAVLPYSQALSRFAAHLQQLDMESNGKHVNRNGEKLSYHTGPVIFGEPGTNGQHSFYQLLHQGTDIIPMQFIGFKQSQGNLDAVVEGSTSAQKLNANLVAQIVAFAQGKKNSENTNKEFDGKRCSSLLVAEKLTPYCLGSLLSHYENKVMFQGFVWNLNSFDQEGVQLGKVLAKQVLAGCKDSDNLKAYAEMLGL